MVTISNIVCCHQGCVGSASSLSACPAKQHKTCTLNTSIEAWPSRKRGEMNGKWAIRAPNRYHQNRERRKIDDASDFGGMRGGARIAHLPFISLLFLLGLASIEVFSVHVLCCLAGHRA